MSTETGSQQTEKLICGGPDELHEPICWDYSPFIFSRKTTEDRHFVVQLAKGGHYLPVCCESEVIL